MVCSPEKLLVCFLRQGLVVYTRVTFEPAILHTHPQS